MVFYGQCRHPSATRGLWMHLIFLLSAILTPNYCLLRSFDFLQILLHHILPLFSCQRVASAWFKVMDLPANTNTAESLCSTDKHWVVHISLYISNFSFSPLRSSLCFAILVSELFTLTSSTFSQKVFLLSRGRRSARQSNDQPPRCTSTCAHIHAAAAAWVTA